MFRIMYILIFALSGCYASSSAISQNGLDTKLSKATDANLAVNDNKSASIVTIHPSQASHFENLTLRVNKIEDSRCATGTTCIWAGQLIVILEVSNELQETKEIKLVRKRKADVATAFGFSFLLLEVSPHPKKGKTIQLSDQVVKVKITRS